MKNELGPGLYVRTKVFSDHEIMVEEEAPYVGMSIRASGIDAAKPGTTPKKKDA